MTGDATREPATADQRTPAGPRSGPERALVAVEFCTGAAALAGGLLLVIRPDGSLLRADPSVLVGSPFSDWRTPGLLLSTLVGGGFLLTGLWQWGRGWRAQELSALAGCGLIVFEAAELVWLGFQPLQAVFAAVGLVVVVLAWWTGGAPQERSRRSATR